MPKNRRRNKRDSATQDPATRKKGDSATENSATSKKEDSATQEPATRKKRDSATEDSATSKKGDSATQYSATSKEDVVTFEEIVLSLHTRLLRLGVESKFTLSRKTLLLLESFLALIEALTENNKCHESIRTFVQQAVKDVQSFSEVSPDYGVQYLSTLYFDIYRKANFFHVITKKHVCDIQDWNNIILGCGSGNGSNSFLIINPILKMEIWIQSSLFVSKYSVSSIF